VLVVVFGRASKRDAVQFANIPGHVRKLSWASHGVCRLGIAGLRHCCLVQGVLLPAATSVSLCDSFALALGETFQSICVYGPGNCFWGREHSMRFYIFSFRGMVSSILVRFVEERPYIVKKILFRS
jgi:hypothetical protein